MTTKATKKKTKAVKTVKQEAPEKFMVHDPGQNGYCGRPEWHQYTMNDILDNYTCLEIPKLQVFRLGERLTVTLNTELSGYVAPVKVAKKATKKKAAKKAEKKIYV